MFKPNIAKYAPLAIKISVTFEEPRIIAAEFSVEQPPIALLTGGGKLYDEYERGSLECRCCGEVFEPSKGPVTECNLCGGKKLLPYVWFEEAEPEMLLDPSPMSEIPDVDICCPCCGCWENSIDDYEPGLCSRCGWRYGMPVVRKELPRGFDDDLDDWFDRAHPK